VVGRRVNFGVDGGADGIGGDGTESVLDDCGRYSLV
jgi:hypothetical protein